ncbi:MAG TPA: DNA damage-inducible protein D [Pyrinomonadaceae bacterium]|jgi:DNA-damage-inducible protein D|nr:DNA damage-inducible protein D [Pyrinomonadaceae bacterium]
MAFDSVHKALDEKKRLSQRGAEYWSARDVQVILGYTSWENFEAVIHKAQTAAASAGADTSKHFHPSMNRIPAGKGALVRQRDWYLDRYACYLVAMNGDASQKPQVGVAQTYFAVKTRMQELVEQLPHDIDRLKLRERVKVNNRILAGAAKQAGVEDYPRFQNAGYKGLYGGMGLQAIKRIKGIPKGDDLLDRSGRAELAANDFRITQTEERLASDLVRDENTAVNLHHEVGAKVRQTIKELGGTMPEGLKAEPHIKTLTRKRKAKELPPAGEDD